LIVRRAASLGSAHPWLQEYVRGLIARSDRDFFTLRRGETPAGYEPDPQTPLPWDPEVAHLHRLAGDPAARGRLKEDAWLCLRTDPEIAGKELSGADTREDFPGLDFTALAKLEPAALDALRASLKDEDPRDWRVVFLAELPKRTAALERLDAHVAATLADVEKEPSVRHAILHAEALALRGRTDDAAKFLEGKIPQDAALTLEQAHFLVASRLAASGRPAVDRALDTLASPRLWSAWLELPGEPALAVRVERTMTAVGGRGLAAMAGLHAALRADDAAAIAAALSLAKDLPGPVRDYATARALWAEGKKAEVYAIWPDEFPDFPALEESGDWGGWEAVMAWQEIDAFIERLEQQLATLKAKPDATVDDLHALATLLLDPATTATFGTRRVRDAMVACSLVLAHDKASGPLVGKMVDRARLAGASPTDCLRIEARSFMAAGEFTAAYSRWLQLIESEAGEILASDYLEAGSCVLEDLQDEAAIELLMRGKGKFPEDATFAHDAAWLLLTTDHPEEAGILLEHGFTIPFTGEQQQTAIAMLLCAAEQTGRTDRADEAFQELLALSGEWGDDEAIRSLEWPEALTQNLLDVAGRNR
jgi:tetratricopeptide (TPR) repeat protein